MPAQVGKADWAAVQQGPPCAVDAWGLGCLMHEAYAGQPLARIEDLRSIDAIPKAVLPVRPARGSSAGCTTAGQPTTRPAAQCTARTLRQPHEPALRPGRRAGFLPNGLLARRRQRARRAQSYQRLLASQPSRRLNPAKLAEAPALKNGLVDTIAFLESLAVKDSAEKDLFFKRLPAALPGLPAPVAQAKLLPMLAAALEYGGAPAVALGALLQARAARARAHTD